LDIVTTIAALSAGGLGIERRLALSHRTDAAEVVGHHRQRALPVLDGVLGLLKLRGGAQAGQRGTRGNDGQDESFHAIPPACGRLKEGTLTPKGAADGECTCGIGTRFRASVNPPMNRSGFRPRRPQVPLSLHPQPRRRGFGEAPA
jgi:hypothetical protein